MPLNKENAHVTGNASKNCVVCGLDRAGLPRVKDPKGRYYCPDCFDQAKARKEAQIARLADQPPSSANDDTCAETAIDEEVTAPPQQPQEPPLTAVDPSLVEELIAESTPAGERDALEPCDNCGQPVLVGAVVCTACGYHRQTGEVLRIQTAKRRSDWAADTGMFVTPGVAGGGMMALFGILFFIGRTVEPAATALFYAFPIYAAVVSLATIFFAFSRGIGTGLLTFLVPFYVLWFVYGEHDGPYLKWLYGAMLVGGGFVGALAAILGVEALPGDLWDMLIQ